MSSKIEYDDITMEDCTSKSYAGCGGRFHFLKYPRRRTYLEMLNESGEGPINSRVENLKLINKIKGTFEDKYNKNIKSYSSSTENGEGLIADDFSDINKRKKNLLVKKKLEYDEEKEKKFVENYYRIKNAELNKLRFGAS